MKKRLIRLLCFAFTAVFLASQLGAGALAADFYDSAAAFTIEGPDTITANTVPIRLSAYFNGEKVTEGVVWSINRGSACAYISTDGLLTPLANGTVTVMAALPLENVSAVKTVTITGQAPVSKNVQLDISTESSGQIYRDVGLDSEVFFGPTTQNYPIGTEFLLTARETRNDFLFWKDNLTGRILTKEPTYLFTLGERVCAKAVFRSVGGERFVMFLDKNDSILQFRYIMDGAVITVPRSPSIPGYVFDGWYQNGVRQPLRAGDTLDVDKITEDMVYIAGYTKRTDIFTVTVSGGTGGGRFRYDAPVTVTLDPSEIPAGKRFAYWAKDGVFASADEVYTFRAAQNTTVEAVYADAVPTEKGPVLFMGTPTVSALDQKITFLSEWSLPLDYTLIETGILLSTTQSFNLSTSGVLKTPSTSRQNGGQFTVRKAHVTPGIPWYAKAYLLYKYNGTVYTVYSDIVTATL